MITDIADYFVNGCGGDCQGGRDERERSANTVLQGLWMEDVTDTVKIGEFYSRNYLSSDNPFADSPRARHRLSAYFQDYFTDDKGQVGKFIEQELGIQCLQWGGGGRFINWESFLNTLPLKDFLDVITASIQHRPKKTIHQDRLKVVHDLLAFTRRVFIEQNLAYKIDDKGGIHPSVDSSFSIAAFNLIRNLGDLGLEAAREHIVIAERKLLIADYDPRGAIRATFDAAENLMKVIFPRETQLNKAMVKNTLGPYLLDLAPTQGPERNALQKTINSFIDWIEAIHFYRHASGGTEPQQPSETFTLLIVSQGFSFVRWIADTRTHYLNIQEK